MDDAAGAPQQPDPAARTAGSGRGGRAAAVVALMALAAALRLYELGRQSLWVDEGYTAYLVRLTPAGYLDDVRHTVRNILPPLYFTLLHYWTALAGRSEVALRLPSVVAGVLAVPLLYALVARLFGTRTGLLAAGLLTVSLFQLRYAQEARMYALLVLLSLASLYLLVRLLDDGPGWAWSGLAVVDALVVWTHHYGALLLVAEAGYLGVLWAARDLDRRAGRRWLASRALFVVLVAPWGVIFADQLHKVGAYPWLRPVTARSVYDVLVLFAGSGPALAVLAALALLGAVTGQGLLGRLRRRRGLTPEDRGRLLLGAVLAVPMLVAVGWSVAVSPVFGSKYLIASSAALLALAAVGAARLPGRVLPVVAVLLVVAAAAPQYRHFYRDVTKEQWREGTAWIESEAAPGDLVLFNAGYGLQNGYAYYARRTDLELRPFPLGSQEFATLPTREQLDGLSGLAAGHPHAWIVYNQSPDSGAAIARELGELSAGGECRSFVGLAVCRYDLA